MATRPPDIFFPAVNASTASTLVNTLVDQYSRMLLQQTNSTKEYVAKVEEEFRQLAADYPEVAVRLQFTDAGVTLMPKAPIVDVPVKQPAKTDDDAAGS